jgi:hypothetical protein
MKSYLLLIVSAFFISLVSCTKDAEDSANISDAALSSMASSEDLALIRTSVHDNSEWNIKMNSIAAKAYADGINNFPSNSMIVKEKHVNGKVTGYAVMYKAPADKNMNDGWLWSEYDSEGHVIYTNAERGMTCQGCHVTLSKGNSKF